MSEEQEQAYRLAGQRIKEARWAADLSQQALSMNAELDQSTVSKVERQGPHAVSWKNLNAVAEALGCVVEVTFRPKAGAAPRENLAP